MVMLLCWQVRLHFNVTTPPQYKHVFIRCRLGEIVINLTNCPPSSKHGDSSWWCLVMMAGGDLWPRIIMIAGPGHQWICHQSPLPPPPGGPGGVGGNV